MSLEYGCRVLPLTQKPAVTFLPGIAEEEKMVQVKSDGRIDGSTGIFGWGIS